MNKPTFLILHHVRDPFMAWFRKQYRRTLPPQGRIGEREYRFGRWHLKFVEDEQCGLLAPGERLSFSWAAGYWKAKNPLGPPLIEPVRNSLMEDLYGLQRLAHRMFTPGFQSGKPSIRARIVHRLRDREAVKQLFGAIADWHTESPNRIEYDPTRDPSRFRINQTRPFPYHRERPFGEDRPTGKVN